MMNTCTSPLKLIWKVNKPLDQSGEYVDKQIADNLLDSLNDIVNQFEKVEPLYSKDKIIIEKAKEAIKQATIV